MAKTEEAGKEAPKSQGEEAPRTEVEKIKAKYVGDRPHRFDYQGKPKILLPGQTYQFEMNSYIADLLEFKLLVNTANEE